MGGNAAQFPGNDLIRESGGKAVVVIIQYRLGLFGFLPGQKVKDNGELNAGLCKPPVSYTSVISHTLQQWTNNLLYDGRMIMYVNAN